VSRLIGKIAAIAAAGTVASLVGIESAAAAGFRTPQAAISNPNSSPKGLQTIFNNINAGVDVTTEQTADQLWTVNPNGQSGVTLVIEIAGLAGSNTFGIYDPTDNSLIQIFEGDDGNNTNIKEGATLTFTPKMGGGFDVTISEAGPGEGGDTFGTLAGNQFGYYLSSNPAFGGGIMYTEDSKNADGKAHILGYYGDGTTNLNLSGAELLANPKYGSEDLLFAIEDLYVGSDFDYNDMVLFVDNVDAVPEPLTLLGAGAAAGFGAFFKRQAGKRQKKEDN
jgi:hypothetical protein